MNTVSTVEQLYAAEAALQYEYKQNLHFLRQEYVNNNAKFKVGDFIYNVTGIIKVDRIGYQLIGCTPSSIEIKYTGLRYKKVGDILSRTKDPKPSSLVYSLKQFENPIVE